MKERKLEERAKEIGWTRELQEEHKRNEVYDSAFQAYNRIQDWEAKFNALQAKEKYPANILK